MDLWRLCIFLADTNKSKYYTYYNIYHNTHCGQQTAKYANKFSLLTAKYADKNL